MTNLDQEDPEFGDAPPKLIGGYNQTYIVRDTPGPSTNVVREVLFRCGNWCYAGEVSLAGLGDEITLRDVPQMIPMLQRQQGRLAFHCGASDLPAESPFSGAVHLLQDAQDFIAEELCSVSVGEKLADYAAKHPWIEDEDSQVYFELTTDDVPLEMEKITLAASKTYARGLIFITVYFGGVIYVVMQDGEGDQALLDVRFPDISSNGQGLPLGCYDDDQSSLWQQLTVWQSIAPKNRVGSNTQSGRSGMGQQPISTTSNIHSTSSLTSDRYIQSYVVMKPNRGGKSSNVIYRDALFRFGSWCYSGAIQLTPHLTLVDLPYVIPALRMQQSRLEFSFDVAAFPDRSPYAAPLKYLSGIASTMEAEIVESGSILSQLLDKLADMGMSDTIEDWFDGEGSCERSFFEFTLSQTDGGKALEDVFKGVDLVANKEYTPSGVIVITLWFQGQMYAILGEGTNENPLLDSRFPDVSKKGKGYQIKTLPEGLPNWPELRKISIWQTMAGAKLEGEEQCNSDGKTHVKTGLKGLNEEGIDDITVSIEMTANSKICRKRMVEMESKDDDGNTEEDIDSLVEADSKSVDEILLRGGSSNSSGAKGIWVDDSVTANDNVVSEAKLLSSCSGQDEGDKDWGDDEKATTATVSNTSSKKASGGGLEGHLAKMRMEMTNGMEDDEAPWDEFGRPRMAQRKQRNGSPVIRESKLGA
eukprot:76995_1